MKLARLTLLVPVALAAACGSPTSPSTTPVAFTHTVSFGFCPPTSYCTSRLEMSEDEAVLIYSSREAGSITRRQAVDAALWRRVTDALQPAALRSLPGTVGCPDCADGGAEQIEVRFEDDQTTAVTFEYGDDVAGIEAVVDALREVRVSFGPPPASELP
jgi:hypothetical protein